MQSVEAQIAALKATVEAGFAAMTRRQDDFRAQHDARMDRIERVQADRHDENSGHLERIEAKQDQTNGKVIRHEGQIHTLIEQVRTLFKRLDRRRGTDERPSDDDRPVTRVDLRWLILAFAGGVAALAWFLKALGKL